MEVTPAEEGPAPPMGSGSPDIISKFIEVSLSGTCEMQRRSQRDAGEVRRGASEAEARGGEIAPRLPSDLGGGAAPLLLVRVSGGGAEVGGKDELGPISLLEAHLEIAGDATSSRRGAAR